jgi:hypothetical protein
MASYRECNEGFFSLAFSYINSLNDNRVLFLHALIQRPKREMKKALLFTLMFFFVLGTIKSQSIQIYCDQPQLIYNNHVGNEWAYGFELENKIYPIDKPFTIPEMKSSEIKFVVEEQDTYTDATSQLLGIEPSKMEFNKIYSKEIELVVIENRGRYSGNSAKWRVTVKYKKIPGRT